ncbi:MAG: RNA polymerase sigma factor region1.1 domain-containing protein, partial [Alphaproteobacteria bacterium]
MATKVAKQPETKEAAGESSDSPLIDSTGAAVKKLLQRGKERGFVTYDELNKALPPEDVSSEHIEDTMTRLSEQGINVVESEDSEDATSGSSDGDEKPSGSTTTTTTSSSDADLGRTDDPVRMYLREMGSVELLSREGEIAIAKRIEAGREKMISAICESPLTLRAIIAWRGALNENMILLRDIIDLDATYGGTHEPQMTPDTDGDEKAEGEKSEGEKSEGEGAKGDKAKQAEGESTDDDEEEEA